MFIRRLLIAVAAGVVFAATAVAQDKSILVASTTSTQDSGLFDHLLPLFKSKTGIDVRVVAQGSGQAIDTGRRGDADVVFVHARAAEEKFLAEGFGVKRYPVMYNDFILVGPQLDPAGIKGSKDIVAALKTLKDKSVPFISRGDKSGTHQAELKLWSIAGVDITKDKGPWYREIGQGWVPRSIPRRLRMLMYSPIAPPGSRSKTRVISSLRSKATSGYSTSTASYW